MSDTPQGGWWKARDGKWYPPETHPDYRPLAGSEVTGPPAQGWWRANDGNWYPPESAPGAAADTPSVPSDPPSPEPAPGGAVDAATADDEVEEIDLTVPVAPATRTPGSLFGSPAAAADAPGGAVPAGGPFGAPPVTTAPTDTTVAPPAATPTAPPTAPPSMPPTAPSTAEQLPAMPPMPSAPTPAPAPDDVPAGAPAAAAPTAAPSPTRPTIPEDRRGLFDLVPPEEDDTPVTPPTRSRPLFGGSGPTEDAGPTAGAGPVSPARAPMPAPGSPPAGPTAAAVTGAAVGAGAVDRVGAPVAAPIEPAAGSIDTDPTVRAPGIDVPPGPMPTGMPVTGDPSGAGGADDGERSGSRRWLLIAGAAVLVLLLGALAFVVLGGGEDETAAPTSTAAPASSTTTTASTTTTTTTVVPAVIPAQVTGVGTATVDVGSDVTDRFLALVTHDGPGQVSVELLGADGQPTQTLVGPGVSGQYLGVLPVNFAEGQTFRSVRFTGEGPWAVTFVLPASAPEWDPAEGPLTSTGDRVVNVSVDEPSRVRIECAECVAAPAVRAWSGTAGPAAEPLPATDGVVNVPSGTVALQVTATGPDGVSPAWSVTPE